MSESTSEQIQTSISQLCSDPKWCPPSYRYLNATLDIIRVVNNCTVPDDEAALSAFPNIEEAVFVAVMVEPERRNMKMLPWKYDVETNTVCPFGKDTE